ncbi:MAG: 50S ribosomal protein L11 methyltransferase [Ginsengibacter sp.]
MKDTIQLSIKVSVAQKDLLISDLADINFYAFEETENEVLAYIYDDDFDEHITKAALTSYNVVYTKNVIQSQNWNQMWENNYEPVIIDDFVAVRASFHQPVAGVKHEIIITPKMSFGTGHHATTFLMASTMKDIDLTNKIVLDFGTGTGILAILAEKLGAASVVAIDNDDWSIENAKENIANNYCNKIDIKKDEIVPPDIFFDVILCNISLNVIQQNIEELLIISKPGTQILLSGFLIEDDVIIENLLKHKPFTQTVKIQKDKWLLMGYKKT